MKTFIAVCNKSTWMSTCPVPYLLSPILPALGTLYWHLAAPCSRMRVLPFWAVWVALPSDGDWWEEGMALLSGDVSNCHRCSQSGSELQCDQWEQFIASSNMGPASRAGPSQVATLTHGGLISVLTWCLAVLVSRSVTGGRESPGCVLRGRSVCLSSTGLGFWWCLQDFLRSAEQHTTLRLHR